MVLLTFDLGHHGFPLRLEGLGGPGTVIFSIDSIPDHGPSILFCLVGCLGVQFLYDCLLSCQESGLIAG